MGDDKEIICFGAEALDFSMHKLCVAKLCQSAKQALSFG